MPKSIFIALSLLFCAWMESAAEPVPADSASFAEELAPLSDLETGRVTFPNAEPQPAAPAEREAGRSATAWFREHRTWLAAGGGALVVGVFLWAWLASDGEIVSSRPADLGIPPRDPVTGEAR